MVLICLAIAVTASAQPISDKPYLSLTSFNDSWGGGFTEIHDDQRSLGVMADYQFEAIGDVWQIRTTYSVLTDRFNPEMPGRTDELELYTRVPVLRPCPYSSVNVIAGGYVVGDLGGGRIQNFVHDFIDVDSVNVGYAGDSGFYPMIGLAGRFMRPLPFKGDPGGFAIDSDIAYSWAAGYMQSFRIRGGMARVNDYDDKIVVSVGYNTQDVFENPVRRSVAQVENGLFIDYGMRLGLLTVGMQLYPDGNFATGNIGITLLNGQGREPLEIIDLTSEFTALSNGGGFNMRFLWNKLTPRSENFLFDFNYQYWSMDDLQEYPEKNGHFHQFSLGGLYQFIETRSPWQVIPYISLRLGAKNEQVYSGTEQVISTFAWSVNTIGEAGLRLKFPAGFLHDNCYYGVTANYQYALSIATTVSGGPSVYEFGRSKGYFGGGVFVMIDL